jgi:hypothetical protein
MNEEELKKGCGKETDYFNYIDCNDNEIFWKCGEEGEFIKVKVLCPTCQAKLEGFQKGKLEQKKEELELLIKINGLWFDDEEKGMINIIQKRIKQLQKEIGGMKTSEEKQDEKT